MRYVTTAWLRRRRACDHGPDGQVKLFERTFGRRAEITRENIRKAWRVGLEVDWLVIQLATYEEWEQLIDLYFRDQRRAKAGWISHEQVHRNDMRRMTKFLLEQAR